MKYDPIYAIFTVIFFVLTVQGFIRGDIMPAILCFFFGLWSLSDFLKGI